jgi:hypothetical protein
VKRAHILGAVLLTAGWLYGASAAAQVSATADASLFSAYVWRGVTYTNRFVVQPDLSVTVPVQRVSLTGDLWANIEPARYNGFSDISESGGTAKFDVTEVTWAGELGIPVTKQTTLTFGATGYIFPNHSGLTNEENTVELYGTAELDAPLKPTASLYYDVGVVRGAYVEGGISHEFALAKRTSMTLGGTVGFSAGQDADLDASGEPRAESFNFAKNGFTHADLWTTAAITAGAVSVSPTLHVVITGDDVTKASKIEHDPDTGLPRFNRTGAKLWFGVTLEWAR